MALPAAALFAACRGVVFDLDDTLYDRQDTVVRLFESWWGPLPANEWQEINRRDARGHSARLEFFTFLKGRYPVPEATGEALWARYQHEFPAYIRLGAAELVLRRLAQTDLAQAILTNGSSAFQRAKYDAVNLDKFIGRERLFISGELGWEKPDSRAFAFTCGQLRRLPHELLFVGDHPDKDIAGARAAGFRTCWLQKADQEQADAEVTIRQLPELLPWLGLE